MSDSSDRIRASRSEGDGTFVRGAHPALGRFFASLDDLASPPPDVAVRRRHVSSAASIAAAIASTGASKGTNAPSWRAVGWRVAAVAAALAVVVGGLGADDRLPAPAQQMVSSIANAFGIDVPDGNTRSVGHETPGDPDGETGPDSTPSGHDHQRPDDAPRATPADPGEPGEPATPAVPADPDKPDHAETPDRPQMPDPPTPGPTSTPADTAPSTVPDRPSGPQSGSPGEARHNADQGGHGPTEPDQGKKSENSPSDP